MYTRVMALVDKIPAGIWHIICVLASLAAFSLILLNRSPNFLRPLSMSLRSGFAVVIPAAVAVYLALRTRGRVGELISMLTMMSLFALPLAGLWASGQTQTTVLSGLLPLYDAEAYYIDGLRLINGDLVSVFSARRPLFPGLLAVLLKITDRDLMTALAILTAIVGFACYCLAREVRRSHGAAVAAFISVILFLFYRAHSGVSMSENLGVALGVLGFAFLWRGAAEHDFRFVWWGLLVTTLALNARAGAFFMLPLVVLWAGWLFRGGSRFGWRIALFGSLAVVVGFAVNLVFTRLIAVQSGVPFANFSYTLYGLASGGKSWAYIFQAHPEVGLLPEPAQSKRIFELAFQLMRDNPWQTVRGALFNWRMLFSNSWYNIYAYVGGENWNVIVAARWFMYALCLLGVYAGLRDRRDPIHSLIVVASLGILLSVPFLPPTDAYRMRPYAASIVVLAALPALGINLLRMQMPQILRGSADANSSSGYSSTVLFTAGLLLLTLIGPLIVRSIAHPVEVGTLRCSPNLDPVLVRLDAGSSIRIEKQSAPFLDWMPRFHVGTLRQNAHALADARTIEWAGTLEPGHTIFVTLDYQSHKSIIVVAPTKLLPAAPAWVEICGRFSDDGGQNVFYAETVEPVAP